MPAHAHLNGSPLEKNKVMLTQGLEPGHHTSSPQSAHLGFHSCGQSDKRGKRQPTHIQKQEHVKQLGRIMTNNSQPL